LALSLVCRRWEMAKGNGEEISTGSLMLLSQSQGWDHESCHAWPCGFVGVKKVRTSMRGPTWGRIRHTEGRAKLEKIWLKTHVRRTCERFRRSWRERLTEGLFCKFLKLHGGKLQIFKLWGLNWKTPETSGG
jgi:hypothetical protein